MNMMMRWLSVLLISFCLGDDVLVRVTCCAMLANMASSRHSLNYLYERGIVSCMIELLKNSSQEPLANLYVPGQCVCFMLLFTIALCV